MSKQRLDTAYRRLKILDASNDKIIINALNGIYILIKDTYFQHLSYTKEVEANKLKEKIHKEKQLLREREREKLKKKALKIKEKEKLSKLKKKEKEKKKATAKRKARVKRENDAIIIKGRTYFKSSFYSRGYIIKRNDETLTRGIESFDFYDLKGRLLLSNHKLPVTASIEMRKKEVAKALEILTRQVFMLDEKERRQKKEIE